MYNIKDTVYIIGCRDKYMITEISIHLNWLSYRLWKVWTEINTWYEWWQITVAVPSKIWFKV